MSEGYVRVRITKRIDDQEVIYEGIKLPKHRFSGKDILIIKLDNGYNIGVKIDENTSVEEVGHIEIPSVDLSSDIGQPVKPQPGHVSILGCGGTIGSRIDYMTGGVYPLLTAEGLVSQFPEIKKIDNHPVVENVFMIFSENFQPRNWSILAERVYEHIRDGAQGIVITHGTDTLHYTSAALSFMLQNLPVPVVLTGAQRSSDRGSSDAKMNLLSSLASARHNITEVMVCMHATVNDDYCYLHRGTRVRKLHTSRRDAFKSVNIPPLAKVEYPRLRITEVHDNIIGRHHRGEFSVKDMKFDNRVNENVVMLYVYPGIDSNKLTDYLSRFDGVVLVGTGLGHVPIGTDDRHDFKPVIESLIESDIPVVMSSQTIFGRLNLNVYRTGRILRELGVIGHLCDWTPETAYVKLSWVLGHEKDLRRVRQEMETNLVGELSDRSIYLQTDQEV